MKIKQYALALLLLAAVAAGGYGAYQFGLHRGLQSAAADAAPATEVASGAQAGKKPLYWHDPMVPGQKFDKPGKSPFMDMQLVPVYGDGADDSNVTVSPRLQQNLGVRTAAVTKGKLGSAFTAIGSVAYNERDVASVQARSNGFVEHLYVRAPLDPVRKGQALAALYVPDWIAAQEEFLAVRRMQGADTAPLLDGARQRMRLAGMTEAQIRLVETSGKVNARVSISAPISGVVAELDVREGMTVAVGAPLFRINGVSTVWVNAEVPENVAGRVQIGDAVEARVQAVPGSVFKGKVGAIVPEVSTATRTLKARIELVNTGGRLVPGMFATLTFTPANAPEVLLVPSEALIQTGTRSVVLLAHAEGKFQPVDVELGGESNGFTEIRKGLAAGQSVVVSGQFLIDSEASLKGAAMRMDDAQSPAADKAIERHRTEGTVEQIGQGEIIISHGPVATLQWGPMTMPFKVPSAGLPPNIRTGSHVKFEFEQRKDGSFAITTIAPAEGKK